MKATFLITAVSALFLICLPANSIQAQIACQYMAEWSQIATPSPYYNACAPEMKTTFTYTSAPEGSYSPIMCLVQGSGWSRIYYASQCPPGAGEMIDTWHCTNLKNHRLLMDIQTGDPPPYAFTTWHLKAEYSAGNPYGPQGP
jgi:hypothetical protein